MVEQERYVADLKSKFDSYSTISEKSWSLIKENINFQTVKKGEILLREGQISRKFYFICKGAMRAFCTDMNGNGYNKNLFLEGVLPAQKYQLCKKRLEHLPWKHWKIRYLSP